ncbi:hypothetical protein AAZX31_15G034000 [Glycine max]|uniref:Uncharacterized protein n=1 Tax=Glycine max TaxID=3847 RepID=K7M9C5_SOYBN|nr:uncharacterized protein LOC100819371 [Glycine max]KAG4948103.1 hypothetical protein JHK86_041342 [Glycine max]KAG5115434.1 hypothetical protein JHK84_041547 [Glycine max]KAH1207699.1 hypothetical protein GmHk_15G042730 [Glycine max]KRH10211.1 hypothetical protein GLYMA_15G034900v4 [Glycine max]|eukprot:XP_003547005.1 uncharacterized protein LOC100819371 [Glycine max]
MAVELHTSLPSHLFPDDNHDVVSSQHNHKDDIHHASALNPLPELPMKDNDDDFISELTHRMARFLLPDDDTFDFSSIDLDSSRDSKQGSPEGSSQEASAPATPEECCWKSSYDMFGTVEEMKLNETGNSNNKLLRSSNIELYSYQSLIQEQIRAIEMSGVKPEHVVVSPKRKPSTRRAQTYEAKKGNGRRARPSRPGPQQGGAGMRVLFLKGPGSRAGTGVFLPRGDVATTPSDSTNKQGKGCSTVLIPARVVQALQLHFDQMAATSGPKAGGFPPLHDVLVSNRDGMYSLQKPRSQNAPASIQNDTILPQEWTY